VVLVLDALAARFGGTAYAGVQLTEALLRRDDVARVVVVAERGSIIARGLQPGERLALVDVAIPRRPGVAWRAGWEAVRLPGIIAAEQSDVLLSFSGMVPRHPRCRVISLLANPVPFEKRRRSGSIIRRAAIARTARQAHRLYVPTREMAGLVARPNTKVVPLGVDHRLFRPAGAPGGEILCVADFYPHKRHDLILAAWSRLAEPRPTLRLIGNPAVDEQHFARVKGAAPPEVIVAGRVGRAELVAAYRRARVVVLASEHESFAMPLAEALCSGVPVIARDLPALRETGGSGAVYVAGTDPDAWASAMERLLGGDTFHAELRTAALEHGRRFSWDTMAGELVADARD
jgi:glycosyltransferase involved in cell wall biosynthesis